MPAKGRRLARDLFVLPDFHGNRSPLADPLSRGAISGLTLDSSFDSLARLYYATAVGIALGTRHVVDALNAHGYDIRHLHLTGGHVANPLLVRLYADATDCTVELPDEEDSVLLGTAMAAAAAAGLHGSLVAAARAMGRAGRSIDAVAGTRGPFRRPVPQIPARARAATRAANPLTSYDAGRNGSTSPRASTRAPRRASSRNEPASLR